MLQASEEPTSTRRGSPCHILSLSLSRYLKIENIGTVVFLHNWELYLKRNDWEDVNFRKSNHNEMFHYHTSGIKSSKEFSVVVTEQDQQVHQRSLNIHSLWQSIERCKDRSDACLWTSRGSALRQLGMHRGL